MNSVVRRLMALSLALAALFAAPAHAIDSGDIVVASVKGEVRVTMQGAERPVRAGSVLELPATIDTGRDGAIELRQGATTMSVGPETRLEFPALEKRGGPIDRIVQPRGNAFYNIGKREGRRLRVETPYLVGVVKGTEFNVVAQEDAATISLFEGLLEIRASDDSSVIDIKAGEIASRKRGGKSINVMKMEGGITPPTQRGPDASGEHGSSQSPGPSTLTNDDLLVGRGVSLSPIGADVMDTVRRVPDTSATIDAGAAVATGISMTPANTNVDVGVAAGLDAGAASIDAGMTTNANPGTGAIDLGANVAVDAGAIAADAGAAANVNLGAGAVDVGANVAVDAGALTADVGSAANVDLGAGAIDAGADVSVDAGPLTADSGAAAAVDVGAGNVGANVDLSAGADIGSVAAVDAGVGTAVDLGTTVDVAANVDVGANIAGVAAAVNAGVDVAGGNVDLGVNVAGVELNLGLDLGLDDGNNGGGNDPGGTDPSNPGQGGGKPSPATPVIDVGGLLDGILNRHRKK